MSDTAAKRTIETPTLRSGDLYRLLTGLIVPRPIGWIGTVSDEGSPNLAPFSFCTAVAWRPPTVLFSTETVSKRKDTLVNAETTREFTLNIVTEDIAEAMVLTSGTYDAAVDEFELAGLTAGRGSIVAAPLVTEAKANLECRVTDIVAIGDPPSAAVVFGEVVAFHVAEELLDGTRVDPVGLRAVGRMAGSGYTRTRELFFIDRPD